MRISRSSLVLARVVAALVEMAPAGSEIVGLGTFFVRNDDCGTVRDRTRQDVDVIHARPGRTLRFFKQTYRGTCDDRPRWTRRGALTPVTPETGE